MKISKFDDFCTIIAQLIIKPIDFLIELLNLDEYKIDDYIRRNNNILNLKTHTWNKRKFRYSFEGNTGVFCNTCNVGFIEALYKNESESLSCTEQQIKNLLE